MDNEDGAKRFHTHHDVIDKISHYYWNVASEDERRKYYEYKGNFICPTCEELTDNYESFEEQHRFAGGFLNTKKSLIYKQKKEQENVTSNTETMMYDVSDDEYAGDKTFVQSGSGPSRVGDAELIDVKPSLRNACKSLIYDPGQSCHSIKSFIEDNFDILLDDLALHAPNKYKLHFGARVLFHQATDLDETVEKIASIKALEAPQQQDTYEEKFNFFLQRAEELDEKFDTFSGKSSGWVIDKVVSVTLACSKYSNLCRLSGRSYIPTPAIIAQKKCCINVKNYYDQKCFLYSILAVLKYDQITKHHERVAKYQDYLKELKYREVDMPMKLKDISRFEKNNPHLGINVIKYTPLSETEFKNTIYQDASDDEEKEQTYFKHPCFDIVYRSQWYLPENHKNGVLLINLLLIEDENGNSHYLGVRNLERLLNCNPNNNCPIRIRGHICDTCLRVFRHKKAFEKHKSVCLKLKISGTVYTMPSNKDLCFKDWQKTISPKFMAYADFESMLIPCNEKLGKSTFAVEKHIPIASAFLMLKPDGTHEYEKFYGSDSILQFLINLEKHAKIIKTWYEENDKQELRTMTDVQLQNFSSAQHCYLCKNKFEGDKVIDHDHFTGLYLGAACNACNLARRIRKPFLPVAFHNLRGYDMHHIIKYAISKVKNWTVQCIPQSSEKFQALMCYIKDGVSIRFIDTFQFLPTSLNNLANMLEVKPYTDSISDLPICARDAKGVFPYSYISSETVLEQHRDELPPIDEAFCDVLTGKINISEDDYERAQQVWSDTGCINLKEYMMIYLKIDVHLLADIFEKFRQTAIREDKLDPANFFSIPGLSWCSALRSMSQSLELIQDLQMYEFFEAGVRGGMTFVNKHYAFATDGNTELLYIDINNLYGWALSQMLPCDNFQWIHNPDKDELLSNLPDESSNIGYLFEVDMHVNENLHDKFADLPPAPVMKKPPNSKVAKLLLTLEPKRNYVIHSALLKFYIEVMGVSVTKIHRAVKFNQSLVFKSYIDYNTERRAASSSKFDKDYYKLKNNSLFGKTVENLRRRKDVRFCKTEKSFVSYASKPLYKKFIQIDENLVIALLTKETICLDRPVYIGQAILDLSKLRMYRLQYEDLESYRRAFPESEINILAGDTDSFFLEVKHIDVENDLLPKMLEDGLLDTSNYTPASSLYSKKNENKIGLFKDESGGKVKFLEWVFLRPKCYSMLSDKDVLHKAKGVMKKTTLTHEQYMDIYKSYNPEVTSSGSQNNENESDDSHPPAAKRLRVDQCAIRSRQHQLYTVQYKRVALSIMDDKRVWLKQNESKPYGYFLL